MRSLLCIVTLVIQRTTSATSTINILSFAPSSPNFHQMNFQADPVMGGKSTGSFKTESNIGIFSGTVRDVPSLSAPGFIKIQTSNADYPNISTCSHILIEAMSNNADYQGWRIGLGNSKAPQSRRFATGHKADFSAPSDKYQNISVAFDSFTNYWDPATGDAIVTCKENVKYCLTISILENVQTISIWAEGVNGDVTLNIRGIYATGCNGVIDGSLSNIGIVGKDVSKTTYLIIAMMVIIGGFAYL